MSLRAAGLATLVLLIPALVSAQTPAPGIVIVANDDWMLSDQAFAALPTDTANLAVNVARLVAGEAGGSIHAYSDYFSLTGTQLASTLRDAGYTFTSGVGIPFDLPTLSAYDALLMGIPLPSSAQLEVLRQYVERGGSVYIHGGNGISQPDLVPSTWNPLLDAFGLRFGRGFNGLRGNITVVSSHSLLAGVSRVFVDQGHPITGCCSVATSTTGAGLFAVAGTTHARYLAEGATGSFFDTRVALLNTGTAPTTAAMQFLKHDGTIVNHSVNVNALTRVTVDPETIPGLSDASFSTVVRSATPLVVDRTMTWGAGGYGSHAETSLPAPAVTWYVAEGSTSGDFVLFYLIQNPNTSTLTATVRYLRPFGQAPIVRSYTLPPSSRTTIPVDGQGPELASTDVSAIVTTTQPVIVERAMYLNRPNQVFAAGHGAAGVTAPSTQWFLAEGATGAFFDLFILLANPNDQPAEVSVDYLLLGGSTHTKSYTLPANGRFTIWVDDEQFPAGSGVRPLDNVAVSSTITSTNGIPIVAERTMWWPSPAMTANFWTEAHNSPAASATATRWALAEGEVGGPQATETYILIANTSAFAGSAQVTLYFEDGSSTNRTYALPPRSRTNVRVSGEFPVAAGRRFGSVIESLGATPAQVVVERAMYTSLGGVVWAAGTNALATPLSP